MVYRAAVLSLLGVLLILHITSELRELGRDVHIYKELHALRHAAHDTAPAPAIELPEGVVVVDASRTALDQMIADHHAVGPARVVPSLRDDRMIGFKVYGIRADSLLGTLGLRSGDTLTAINDVPVTDTAATLRLFEDDALPAYLDLTVRRQGRPLRIVVLIHG